MSALQQRGLRMRTAIPHLLALCALLGTCAPQAKADVIADFYKGRTVTVVVSSSAGGGYDTLARALARYMGRHMPGHPIFVVRNMSPSSETAMVLIWHAVPVNSVAELKAREVAVGVSGANSTPAFFTRLLNATLGTKMKPVNGYPGQNDVLLAMERGELDGHPSAFFSSLRSTRPAWLRDKTAKAIVQYGPEKLAELPDVPFAPDLVASDDDKLLMQAAVAPLTLGRPFLAPPGVPVERLAALREAFAATMADPDFLAEGEKLGLGLNAPRAGAQIQEVMERAYQSPPRVIDRLRQLNVP